MTALAPRSFAKARPTELCQLSGRWTGVLPEGGAMCERKYDGWRALFFRGLDRQPGLWTRSGILLLGAGHIRARLLEIEEALGGPHFVDGELVVGGSLAATKLHCESGWRSGDAGTFHAFDCVPMVDWERGQCDTPLFERKAALARAIASTAPDAAAWEWSAGTRGAGHGVDLVELVTDTWAFTAADVEGEAQRGWAVGHEGIVIKRADAPYVRGRSDAWLKLKRPGVD